MRFSIICASNNSEVLLKNLLASPNIKRHDLQILLGSTNVCQAYNSIQPEEDIVLYIHQDVYLPASFFPQLTESIQKLADIDWGVLGVAGRYGPEYRGYLLDRGAEWGSPLSLPNIVDTLDEVLLVQRRNTFRFDELIPSYHLFGTDICLQAKVAGKQNFAIEAFCHHNSRQNWELPESFQESANYIKQKWHRFLPIYSTCMDIT